MAVPRVYVDTSVFGGVFDDEFAAASRSFFDQVRQGRFALVTSAVVRAEIEPAPNAVRQFFREMIPWAVVVDPSAEALALRKAYLDARILRPRWAEDALHVAPATVSGCPMIVNWNFKHIVQYQKIPLYNAVNQVRGYSGLAIFSPLEVIEYED